MTDAILIVLTILGICGGICGLIFSMAMMFHDPVTMPMKLKTKVYQPSLFDRFLLRLNWLRKPWTLSPAATEIVISRALAEPRLAHSIAATLTLALRQRYKRTNKGKSYSWDPMTQKAPRLGPSELASLDWLVPGTPEDVFWCIDGKRLDVCAKWHNGLALGSQGLTIPGELLPDSIRSSLAGRRLGDLMKLPFARPDHIIEEDDIRYQKGSVILDLFRDTRDLNDIRHILDVIATTTTLPGLTAERK